MNPVARSAMHGLHVRYGARLAATDGWEVPAAYGGGEDEARAARDGAGLWDLSALTKWRFLGAGTGQALETLRGVPAPAVGRASAGRAGGVEVLALRLAEDHALVLGPPGLAADAALQATAAHPCAHMVNATSGLAGIRLAGPAARAILSTLTALDVGPSALPNLACAETGLARAHAVLLRRDVAGLPAFEVYASRNYGAYLWEAVLDAGGRRGLVSCGLEAERLLTKNTSLSLDGRGQG